MGFPTNVRKGGFVVMYPSRTRFYPLDPRADEVRIEDIAHHLSNLARFGGGTPFHYSVAQHSVLMTRHILQTSLDSMLAKLVLMHDGHEAYIGDWQKPVKRHVWFQTADLGRQHMFYPISVIEMRLDRVITDACGLVWTRDKLDIVQEIDRRILAAEKQQLFPDETDDWPETQGVPPLPVEIKPWTPEEARREFLNLWNQLR